MTNEIKEQVEQEIEEHKEEFGDDWIRKYINNFYASLPGGFRRDPRLAKKSFRGREDKKNEGYWRDVDNAMSEAGVSLEETKRLIAAGRANEANVLNIPTLIKLRERGYTQQELKQ